MKKDQKKYTSSKPLRKRKEWTILCIPESGDTSSFKLSRNSVVMFVVLVAFSFSLTIAAIMGYAVTKAENEDLRSSLEAIEKRLADTNAQKENLTAQLFIMQTDTHSSPTAPRPSQKSLKKTEERPRPSEKKPEKPEQKPAHKAPVPASASQINPAAQTNPPDVSMHSRANVSVDDCKLYRSPETNEIRYEFAVRNTHPQKKVVSGYTFVLLKPSREKPASWRISPQTPLNDGRPENPMHGQLFEIARFMNMRGYVKDTESIDEWEEAVVFVYSASGEPVLEKVVE